MSFFDTFSKKPLSAFADWGPPPVTSEIPAGRGVLPSLPADKEVLSATFGPAVLIGLGTMGRAVLEQWLTQTASYTPDSFRQTRLLLISSEESSPLPSSFASLYSLFLRKGTAQSPLEALLHASVTRKLTDWMRANMLGLRDFQILIVGSVAEPEIQLLGGLLQIVRSFLDEHAVSSLNAVAFLSLVPWDKKKNPSFEKRHAYAALREVGRFTFSGLHKGIEMPGVRQAPAFANLLDHLFLFDESAFQTTTDVQTDLAQALGELLFFLCHPAASIFWQGIKNNPTGVRQNKYSQPFVNTIGLKTFFLPLREIQDYLSARLARAVLFGERAQDTVERFVSHTRLSAEDQRLAEMLARRWLTEQNAAYHPVFEWIATVHSQSITAFPDLDWSYHDLYAYKVSLHLVHFLNEEHHEAKLALAERALEFHIRWFGELLQAAQAARAEKFAYTLHLWKTAAESLHHALRQWQKTLSPEITEISAVSLTGLQRRGWRLATESATPSVNDVLLRKQKEAENALKEISGGQTRFSLTYNKGAPWAEVERYYEQSVRPELLRAGLPVSPAFRVVRNHLEWWVRLRPARPPELMVVCWNGSFAVTPHTHPPDEVCFSFEDSQKLAEAVLTVASARFVNYEELTGTWYLNRLQELVNRIDVRADEVFLAYDENEAAKYEGEVRHYYLAAKNKTITAPLIKKLFPLQTSESVQEIDSYDPTRLAVLAVHSSIPVSAIYAVQKWYAEYTHDPHCHTYTPEKIAATYEDRYLRLYGDRRHFPPNFVMALADAQLVTLFCQALIVKLIDVQENSTGNPSVWQLAAIDGFAPLPLALDTSPEALFDAFRQFTLELPNDPNLLLNPSHPFHPYRRNAFLEALLFRTQAIRNSEKIKELKTEFQKGILAEWIKRKDPLAVAFSTVLQVELEEPVWEGWYT